MAKKLNTIFQITHQPVGNGKIMICHEYREKKASDTNMSYYSLPKKAYTSREVKAFTRGIAQRPEIKEEVKNLPEEVIQSMSTDLDQCVATLSTRAKFAVIRIWAECDNVLYNVYEWFIDPDTNCRDFHNVGKQTGAYVDEYRDRFLGMIMIHL